MDTSLHYFDPEMVKELNQVMFEAITAPERLGAIFNVQKGVAQGDKVVLVGDLGLQGAQEEHCSPEWDTANLLSEKEWNIGDFAINISQCYKDIPAVFKRMLSNVDGADARKNEYVDSILRPRVETALEKMYVRLGWFGSATSQGTELIAPANAKYFLAPFEGIFPYAQNYIATHASQHVAIAPNAQATWQAQKTAMLVAGVATGIMDEVIMSAPTALRQSTDGVMFVTLAMADALEMDIKKNNKGSELQWQALENGVKLAKYNGIDLVAVPAFDEVLGLFLEADRNPYRVFYTTRNNVQFGTQGTEEIAEVNIDYDPYRKLNLISATDHFGALIAQDNLFVYAV